METLIIKYDGGNSAVKQVLEGLKKMGAITIEHSIYNDEMVEKINRSEKEFKAGKGVIVDIDKLWS